MKTTKTVEDHLREGGLGGVFGKSATMVKNVHEKRDEALQLYNIVELARDHDMSLDEVKLVRSHFDVFDEDGSGALDQQEFEKAMVRVLQSQNDAVTVEQVHGELAKYWNKVNADGDDGINFNEFLKWYRENRFKEDVLLNVDERRLRELAKKHKITLQDLELIKRIYDTHDIDGNGTVDEFEFTDILYRVLRVPKEQTIPHSRVRLFWVEIDQDRSGGVSFEEFLEWWVNRSDHLTPYEDFYWRIRPVGGQVVPGKFNPHAEALKRGGTGRAPGLSSPQDCPIEAQKNVDKRALVGRGGSHENWSASPGRQSSKIRDQP